VKSLGQFLRMVLVNIRIWWGNPKCPLCYERTRNIEGHLQVDHIGDKGM
jgi:hypothetical protein